MNLELFKPELSPQNFTSEQLGAALDAAEMLQSKLKALYQEATKRLLKDLSPEERAKIGWHLVKIEGRTKILDSRKARRSLAPYMPESEYDDCCTPSVTDVIQAIRDREGCTMQEAKNILRDCLGSNLGKSDSSVKLERIPKQIEAKPVDNPEWIQKMNEGRGPAQLGKVTHENKT